MILNILITLYAALTIFAVISDRKQKTWLNGLTLAAALCLLLGLWQSWLVPAGIGLLIAAAIAQGHQRYGRIHWSHLTVRLIFSAVILGLWGAQHWL